MADAIDPHNDDEEAIAEDSEDIAPGGSHENFADSSALKNHLASFHTTQSFEFPNSKKKEGSGRLLCPKGDCGTTLVSYEALGRHCADEHGFVAHCENLRFENLDHFREWLDHLITISGDMVKRRGERKTAEGICMGDYHCIFDGKKRETRPTRMTDRAPYNRRVPSKKLGFACPAFIRYQVHLDETVTIRSQLQHFGHDVKPTDGRQLGKTGRRGRNVTRSKDRRRGYAFDGLNYDEIDSHPFIDEDGMEIDIHGMVNLSTFPALERARYRTNSSGASMDIALLELGSIPHENVHGVYQLIEKLHEISDAANIIESLIKDLASTPNHLVLEEDSNKSRVMSKPCLQLNRKRLLPVDMKDEGSDGKHARLDGPASHGEESFDQRSESGDMDYEGDRVVEEVVVEDEHDEHCYETRE